MTEPKEARRPSRDMVFAAADILKSLGSEGVNRLLAIYELPDPDVGWSGGLKARLTSIARFTFANPGIKTSEGRLVAESMVDRALQIYRTNRAMSPNVSTDEREAFARIATEQGYDLQTRESPKSDTVLPVNSEQPSKKVFLVHGRDGDAKIEVELFLRTLGLDPIVLHRQPNKGRNILQKFQDEAEGAVFAVVLMTPDDEGSLVGEAIRQKRARQNVVFELGFFIGKLGPAHVAALMGNGVEKPSDFYGIGYIEWDAKSEWKRQLASEMHAVGVPFDLSLLLRS